MENAGLIEMTLVFLLAIGLGLRELWSLRRDRRRAEREDRAPR
ncbi:hypothetical protein ACE7GA_06035 [Roseomonas sp. CCTCC AB2023176]